ncbi:MAG: PilZ domain-containing protein [Xanthomonadales bacterium]|nr:PilZ domain-containing protein [Xanthomonadales bacterium]
MSDYTPERRQYSRVAIDLPVEVQQGGSVWHQRLIDLSLGGAATDQPDLWDAQYNEPFTLVIHISNSSQLELHAYLQHVEAGRLGFSVEHVDRRNIAPLRALLEQHISDITVLEQELQTLQSEAD